MWHWIECFFKSTTLTNEVVMARQQQLYKEQAEKTRMFVASEGNKMKAIALVNPTAHTTTWQDILGAKEKYDAAVEEQERAALGLESKAVEEQEHAPSSLQLPMSTMPQGGFDKPPAKQPKGGKTAKPPLKPTKGLKKPTRPQKSSGMEAASLQSFSSRTTTASPQTGAAESSVVSLSSGRSTAAGDTSKVSQRGALNFASDMPDTWANIMNRITPIQILHENIPLEKKMNGHQP